MFTCSRYSCFWLNHAGLGREHSREHWCEHSKVCSRTDFLCREHCL